MKKEEIHTKQVLSTKISSEASSPALSTGEHVHLCCITLGVFSVQMTKHPPQPADC